MPRYTTCTPVAELYIHPLIGIANSSAYSMVCERDAARSCHAGMRTGGGGGCVARQARRSDVNRKIVTPMDLCHRYSVSFVGEMRNGTIESPRARLARISTAVIQCSAMAPPL